LGAQVETPHEGDRSFLRQAAMLRREPNDKAASVTDLLPGDEVAVQEPEDNAFHDPPADWLLVTTTEVPSHRLFSGWIRISLLTPDPPKEAARLALLRQVVEQRLDELAARKGAFATLRDQAIHWRGIANGERQARQLSDQLAQYMSLEITPRALEVIDRLDELRGLDEPRALALGKRLDELSKGFQP
jgi:hypothetical protein